MRKSGEILYRHLRWWKRRELAGVGFFLRTWLLWLCLGLGLLHATQVMRFEGLDRIDAFIYDSRIAGLKPAAPNANVVIVDIDEASLGSVGRWPWSNTTVASLTTTLLQHYGVRVLGFNMVFPESGDAQADQMLASALMRGPVVLGHYLSRDRAGDRRGDVGAPVFVPQDMGAKRFHISAHNGYSANSTQFTSAAGQAGFLNTSADGDGVVRSAPLVARLDGWYYESLALGVYRRWLAPRETAVQDLPRVAPVFSEASTALVQNLPVPLQRLSAVRLNGKTTEAHLRTIAIDERASMLVGYRGKGGPFAGVFQYFSAKDVLERQIPLNALKDKVVLVGSSAPSLEDLRVTPVAIDYPAVEIQASLVAGLIEQSAPWLPNYAERVEIVQLLVVGVLSIFVLQRLSAIGALIVAAGLGGGLWLLHLYLYAVRGLVLPLASGLGCVLFIYVVSVTQGLFFEARRRKNAVATFGKYISPSWVERVVNEPVGSAAQATSQVLTVMFCDMRGFTRLSANLAPLELQALLSKIFTQLSAVIQAHEGTIDKFMGDCVMAFWGAPTPQSDHAVRAVRCGVQMLREMASFNVDAAGREAMPMEMGIGVHTGLMCVGDMGSELRRSYTVIGEAVNLAARLEAATKSQKVNMLVTRTTYETCLMQAPELEQQIHWKNLGSIHLAGIENPVPVMGVQP